MGGHVTEEEMLSQPDAWAGTLKAGTPRLKGGPVLDPGDYDRIYFVGSGSSYYLGLTLASLVSRKYPGACAAVPSCEILMFPELCLGHARRHLIFIISRSGRSTEAVLAAERLGAVPGCDLVALTCHEDSPLARRCGSVLAVAAGAEKGVVMTRSFTSMLLAFALYHLGCDPSVSARAVASLAEAGRRLIERERPRVKAIIQQKEWARFVFLGSGPLYGIAREAGLKVQEMAIASTEGYHLLEYRHGPKSTADGSTLVTAFLPPPGRHPDAAWVPPLLRELKGYGAGLVAVGVGSGAAADGVSVGAGLDGLCDLVIDLPEFAHGSVSGADAELEPLQEWLSCCLAIVPGHLLGYSLATLKGLDPDNPRNLTQVVELGGA